jgi:DNA-binding MarR family transcriptional regulator
VRLSAKGQALVRRLIPIALDLERVVSAGISSRNMVVTKRVLRRVYANLAAAVK